MVAMVGYTVRTTDAAIAFVAEVDATVPGIKPLWIPRKKILATKEADALGRKIQTAQDGERIGIPTYLEVDDAFIQKVKGA